MTQAEIEAVARAIKHADGNVCISSRGLCRNLDGCICRDTARAAIRTIRALDECRAKVEA